MTKHPRTCREASQPRNLLPPDAGGRAASDGHLMLRWDRPTKTIAKLANKLAKNDRAGPGVVDLSTLEARTAAYSAIPLMRPGELAGSRCASWRIWKSLPWPPYRHAA